MSQVEEYRRRAEEAERRAQDARFPGEQEAYAKIAQGWRDLENSARRAGARS